MNLPPAATGGGLPKEARLRKNRDFDGVRGRGRRHVGREAVVRVVATDRGRPRLGLAASRKYGGAVRRNRFKRVARAAFRLVASSLGSRDFLVEPRRGLAEPTRGGVAADLCAAAGVPRP